MTGFLKFVGVCVLIAALPPARWGFRLWLALAMPGGTLLLMSSTAPFHQQGALHHLPGLILITTLTALLAGVVIRWLLSTLVARGAPESGPFAPIEIPALRGMDICLAVLAGSCGGLFLTLAVALALRGFPGGLALHLAVSLLAVAAVVLVLRRFCGLIRPAFAAALSVLAVLALLGGVHWPDRIAARADRISSGQPHCLRADDRPATVGETMLLTLPRGSPGSPGLILTVTTPRGPVHYRWSYRADRFVRFGHYRHGACPE
ncbi:MAG: hypothetical protein WCZ72_04470 [Gemmobacter sp.]